MALVEVYGSQLEELSFQANHRYYKKKILNMCARCYSKYGQ